MLRWLLNQFLPPHKPSPPVSVATQPDPSALMSCSQPAEGGLLRRRAIYNQRWQIVAYTLTLRDLTHQPGHEHSHDQVLLCEIKRLLDAQALKTQIWLELSWKNLPLLLKHHFKTPLGIIAHGDVPFSPDELAELLAQMRPHYRLGATAKRWHLSHAELGPQLQCIALSIQSPDFALLSQQIATCRQIAPHAQLWVNDVDSREAAEACFQLGADYVSGRVFNWSEAQQLNFPASFLHLNQILQLSRQNADAKQIADELKTDPALSARLLRYVNSAALGLPHAVGNLEQAMMLIGNQRLYRWLSLLLFSSNGASELDQTLLETALCRARLMELAGEKYLSHNDCELLFITGLFSLLDFLLGVPRSLLLHELNPPTIVVEALSGHENALSPYLALAESAELAGPTKALLAQCQLSSAEFNQLQMQAMLWTLSTLAS
jgi:EAL and modified HD-GYP domain-containing signal transduction protein